MERIKSIFSTFFDVNLFSFKRLIIAILVLICFFILKGLLSKLILRIFKIKGKDKIKSNNFYKPLKIFFGTLGLYLALIILGPSETLKNIINIVFRSIIIILVTYSLGNLVAPKSRFEKQLKKKLTKSNDSMIKMICKTLKVIIYILGGVVLISELGFNISGIIAGIGIGGVAIALAAQDTASNIIGALMIILDKPFEIGDWIEVGTTSEGSVEEFTFRSTRIRESENTVVSIPNSTIVNSVIINWSRLQKRKISLDLHLDVTTSLKKIADVQNEILIYLENEPNILNDYIYVKLSEIRADGLKLEVVCYTNLTTYLDYVDFKDKVNFKIMSILQNNKVSLTSRPQTLYVKND